MPYLIRACILMHSMQKEWKCSDLGNYLQRGKLEEGEKKSITDFDACV